MDQRYNNNVNFNRERKEKETVNIIVQFSRTLNLEVGSEDLIELLKSDLEELTNQT